MPQGFTESPYFSQILKVYLDDIKFPRDMLQYIHDLLLCSLSQASSQEDNIYQYLLKLLALEGHKVTKKKMQFSQTQV